MRVCTHCTSFARYRQEDSVCCEKCIVRGCALQCLVCAQRRQPSENMFLLSCPCYDDDPLPPSDENENTDTDPGDTTDDSEEEEWFWWYLQRNIAPLLNKIYNLYVRALYWRKSHLKWLRFGAKVPVRLYWRRQPARTAARVKICITYLSRHQGMIFLQEMLKTSLMNSVAMTKRKSRSEMYCSKGNNSEAKIRTIVLRGGEHMAPPIGDTMII